MMIARKLAIDELHITERPFRSTTWTPTSRPPTPSSTTGEPGQWPRPMSYRQPAVPGGEAPQAGARPRLRQRRPTRLSRVPGMADYCVYWFRKAHDTSAMHARGPGGGPRGIGRDSERPQQSIPRRVGSTTSSRTGTIIEAVDNQPWSGEANVHVSIANWVKTQDPEFISSEAKFWFKSRSLSPGVSPHSWRRICLLRRI